ncbi:MAG TPA: 3,4-dihydroxy-2-butanone-4-phosphate synthase [Bryobacteraceae bacterium]|nr:3,4-dihydroxy-2-butanone-4-phosphate synthase [Bryobacteraceae bacterium]
MRPGTSTVRQVAQTRIPTKWGMFQAFGFESANSKETAIALIMGDLCERNANVPLLRVHSQCLTSEAFGSLRCDCAEQLEIALREISKEGRGLVIYDHQEGRGIGLTAKLQAYALQDNGLDTVEANLALGLNADQRNYRLSADILHELGVSRVRLLSNNPAKSRALIEAGIEVVDQVPCEVAPNPHSIAYLSAQKERMGHALHVAPAVDETQFATVETAIREMRAGRMIVVVDDEDRENEGDLTIAAEMITPAAVNFMATHARGLICLAMTPERLDQLELAPMEPDNTALGGTAFTVSIDSKAPGMTTGISAWDRAETIRAAVNPSSVPSDFARPGHVFPLRARPGGVLERRGQTEAAVDLASLAGLYPAGVICEIVNDDGTMARVPDLIRFCRKHELVMITVADLARYRFELDCDEWLAGIDVLSSVSPRRQALAAH